MYVKSVELTNFRNYEKEAFEFSDGLNVVIGKNASGKTNLIESVYCAGLGKSPRTPKYREMIRWGCDSANIEIVLSKKYRDYTIRFTIDSQDKKKVSIDGVPLSKMTQLLGLLNVVFFSPDELKLIKDGPSERRRFMDVSLSQQSKNYYDALSRYNNVLAQRNKLLKEGYNQKNLKECLYSWDVQLAKYGAKIIKARYAFVRSLEKFARQRHSFLTEEKEELTLSYESDFPDIELNQIAQMIEEKLQQLVDKDRMLGHTTTGAQKDDLKAEVNKVDIRRFGSQGQQRTAALSLKLAEINLFKEETGETPVLILDDVLSELDAFRSQKLLEGVNGMQTLITGTQFDFEREAKIIIVSEGKNLKD